MHATHERALTRVLVVMLSLVVVVAGWGCAPTIAHRVVDGPLDLDSDEGILIVDVDTDRRFDTVRIGSYLLHDVATQGDFRLIRLRAGRYTFGEVRVRRGYFGEGIYDLAPIAGNAIEVRPREITYPGRLIIRRERGSTYLRARFVNRSSEAIRTVEERFPAVLSVYSMRYGGGHRDDFIQFYLEAREAQQAYTAERVE